MVFQEEMLSLNVFSENGALYGSENIEFHFSVSLSRALQTSILCNNAACSLRDRRHCSVKRFFSIRIS